MSSIQAITAYLASVCHAVNPAGETTVAGKSCIQADTSPAYTRSPDFQNGKVGRESLGNRTMIKGTSNNLVEHVFTRRYLNLGS